MVFIDYNIICDIIKNINLNTISIDRANCRLTNASVYLSIYWLDVYYIFGRFNLILDALSRFRIIGDDIVRADNEVEPAFDVIWDKDNEEKPDNMFDKVHLVYKMYFAIKIDNFFLTEVVV